MRQPIFSVANVQILTKMWADEMAEDGNCEPDPKLEPFYILAALEFGDPDMDDGWLRTNAVKFYEFWKKYRSPDTPNYSGPKILLQYIFWYQRERPSVDSDLSR